MKRFTQAIATIFLSSVCYTASAEQYISFQLGQTTAKSFDVVCTYVNGVANFYNIDSSCDNKDIGFRLAVGTAITPNFYFEAGYQNFGEAYASLSDGIDYENYSAKASGFDFSVVGKFPINPGVKFVARGGLVRWKVTNEYSSSFGGDDSVSENGISLAVGFGLDINNFTITFDKIKDVGDEDTTGEGDLNRISIGYNFQL